MGASAAAAVLWLGLAGAQAFHFPAGQGDACLEALLDEVVVQSLLVLRDGPRRVFLLFSHRGGIIGSCERVGYGHLRA